MGGVLGVRFVGVECWSADGLACLVARGGFSVGRFSLVGRLVLGVRRAGSGVSGDFAGRPYFGG